MKKIVAATLLTLAAAPAIAAELPREKITLPAGFAISVYADDVPGGRSMALGATGPLFVCSPRPGKVEAVADAGNASAHRGYTPTVERLGHIVDIIENFLHRAFVLAGAAEEIRKATPARKSP